MILLRLLNPQGIAGLALSVALALLLVVQKGETHHWKKECDHFEQLYHGEQSALAGTVADYRAAAAQARAADVANLQRAQDQQRAISERTDHDFEARLAGARAAAWRLRGQTASAAADLGSGTSAPVPGLPDAPGRPRQAAGQDQLPPSDALTATEQAIQLDELIKWVREQASVRMSDDKVAP